MPQEVTIADKPAKTDVHYPNEMWCVTCVPKGS